MSSLTNAQDLLTNNTAAIKQLQRAMMLAEGEFALILACCNSVARQQQILSFLKELSSINIQEITLLPTDETLYTTIKNKLGDAQPQALMVRGLETVDAINQLIISTNIMRDEFRKNCHFPLVLWVNDEIIEKLIWLAPDLKNWSANTIRFDVAENPLSKTPIFSA